MVKFCGVLLAALVSTSIVYAQEDDVETTVERGAAEEAFVVEEPNTLQLGETPNRNFVSMYCYTANGGHTVRITASNSSSRPYTCTSRCYYRRSDGYNGMLNCTGTVAGNANNQLFCDAYNSRYTFVVTNAGSNNCP